MSRIGRTGYVCYRFSAEMISCLIWPHLQLPVNPRIGGGDAGGIRHQGQLRNRVGVGTEVRPELCQADPQVSSGTQGQMLP
jgi:hypothetical protein